MDSKRGLTISVILLGTALCAVMLAYFVFGDSNDAEGLRTLRMIAILFRHGDRSPTSLYPNDPHVNHQWSGGLGALSEKGSLQMYNLGKNLHMRYYRLLPPNGLYSKDDIFIGSSAAERCTMSAQSFMAGFMPPLESRNPLPIPWQPVAIHAPPRNQDYLYAQKKPCRKYDEMLNKFYVNPPPDVVEMNEKYAGMYRMLTKETGMNVTNIGHVELLYNTLSIERSAGLTLPDWTESVFPDKMVTLAERNLALITETPFMKKIKGGSIMTEILDNMVKKLNGLQHRSIFVYSAHDVTLVNFMRAIGVIEETAKMPEYAATIVVELHHSVIYEDDFEVKIVYYFNSEDKFPKELSIPNCESPCSLTAFSKSIEKIIVRNYDEDCQLF
uniref:Putative lysosomal & prostatic acid phosphatase n=1 Tax=Nyssomyia neivai TaxID=330878 RepID=A0A1L8DYX7_9DIPT